MNFSSWYRRCTTPIDTLSANYQIQLVGDKGEAVVSTFAKTNSLKFFESRRVPRPRQPIPHISNSTTFFTLPRQLELDLIVVCDVVLVIEVKNWSGKLELEWNEASKEHGWVQTGRSWNNPDLHHGAVAKKLRLGAEYLQQYLVDHLIELPNSTAPSVVPLLVLTRKNLTVDSAVVADAEAHRVKIVYCDDLMSEVPQRDWRYYAKWVASIVVPESIASIVGSSLDDVSRRIPYSTQVDIKEAIAELPTWDFVHKASGETLRGSVDVLVANGKTFRRRDLPAGVHTMNWSARRGIGAAASFISSLLGGTVGTLQLPRLHTRDGKAPVAANYSLVDTIPIDGPESDNYVVLYGADRISHRVPLQQVVSIELSTNVH
eukprot:PhM_4_TR14802/c0_g2_i1/m.89282